MWILVLLLGCGSDVEVCDGVDNDGDGRVDELAVDGLVAFPDLDGDGFGDSQAGEWLCEQPEGWLRREGDCDDADPGVHPGAEERVGDEVDSNCDGTVDISDLLKVILNWS